MNSINIPSRLFIIFVSAANDCPAVRILFSGQTAASKGTDLCG